MSVRLNSYVSFKDNAREALGYYQSIFGGEVTLSTFGEYASDQMPVDSADADKIMHGALVGAHGVELMASDTPAGMVYSEGSQITLTLNGNDESVLRGYWDLLAADGQVTVPLEKAPWGDTFGMVTDKFGINWMVDIDPNDV